MGKFGTRVKVLRLTKGYSQQELGERVNVNASVICGWENNRLPRASAIPKLARILDIEPKELAELWMEDSLGGQ